MFFGRYDVDFRSAAKIGQCSFPQRAAHDGFDQAPRRGDFTADVDSRRIQRIDDRRQTKSEITRSRIDRRERFRITRARLCDQIFNSEIRGLRIPRARIENTYSNFAESISV